MDYKEAIDFLFTSLPMFQRIGGAAYKADLEKTHRLDDYFGHPHRRFHTIHVAGTNGKGSTSHMLAAILQAAGYKTGLYTSPHLLDFRERIKVNGEMIPENEVVSFVENHRGIMNRIQPSFFEMTVAMAFDYFARSEVEVAVIEVGMGGRLDSTNIITPLLSVITNISHDHGAFLGETLPEIAFEKAGIIKPGIPVVIGESRPETDSVFESVARLRKAPLLFADRVFRFSGMEKGFFVINDIKNKKQSKYSLDLKGFYQRRNICTVLATVSELNDGGVLSLREEDVVHGLEQVIPLTGLQGRWQVFSTSPFIVADTGHNEAGIRQVVDQIAATPHDDLWMVLGFVKDKQLDTVLPLLPKAGRYIFTQANIERAMDAQELFRTASNFGLTGEVITPIPDAVEHAKAHANKQDMIFIGGSTFTVAEALPGLMCDDKKL